MTSKRQESEAERLARYAARDVTDKLGVKPGHAVRVVGQGDPALLEKVRAKTGRDPAGETERADIVLYWPRSSEEITTQLQELRHTIAPAGGIWVICAKKGQAGPGGSPYLPDQILIPL